MESFCSVDCGVLAGGMVLHQQHSFNLCGFIHIRAPADKIQCNRNERKHSSARGYMPTLPTRSGCTCWMGGGSVPPTSPSPVEAFLAAAAATCAAWFSARCFFCRAVPLPFAMVHSSPMYDATAERSEEQRYVDEHHPLGGVHIASNPSVLGDSRWGMLPTLEVEQDLQLAAYEGLHRLITCDDWMILWACKTAKSRQAFVFEWSSRPVAKNAVVVA